MNAGRPEVTSADAEFELPQFEVAQELLPLLWGEVAIFGAWPKGPPAGNERPVVRDHVVGVDR
jgi:hypothetical protein